MMVISSLIRNNRVKTFALILAAAMLTIACGDIVPIEKLMNAKKAINIAETNGARVYASAKLTAARAALHEAHKLVADEKKDDAAKKADEAKQLAEMADVITSAHKSFREANDALINAQKEIERAEAAYAEMYALQQLKTAKDKYAQAEKDLDENKKALEALDKNDKATKKEYDDLKVKVVQTKSVAGDSYNSAVEAYNICAQEVPKIREGINDVEKTIATADSLNGQTYANEKLQTSRSELANAKNMVNEMKLKKALSHLEIAKTNADEALIITQEKRAEERLDQASKALEEAKKSVAADYKKDQLNGAMESYATAKKAMDERRYNDSFSHSDESIRLSKEVIGAEPEYLAMRAQKNQPKPGEKTLEEQKKEYEEIIAFWEKMDKDAKPHTIKWNRNYRETLWRISLRYYGDARLWPRIYRLNAASIKDPDMIYPNQKLIIPPKNLLIPKYLVSKKEAKEKLEEVNKKIKEKNAGK